MTPDKTFAVKGKKCAGGKKAKERVTGVAFCNWEGTDKRKLMIIGRSANPHCLRSAKLLPVEYRSSKKAWMNNAIFQQLLTDFNMEMRIKVVFLESNISRYFVNFSLFPEKIAHRISIPYRNL